MPGTPGKLSPFVEVSKPTGHIGCFQRGCDYDMMFLIHIVTPFLKTLYLPEPEPGPRGPCRTQSRTIFCRVVTILYAYLVVCQPLNLPEKSVTLPASSNAPLPASFDPRPNKIIAKQIHHSHSKLHPKSVFVIGRLCAKLKLLSVR